jgi:hypothetical protein
MDKRTERYSARISIDLKARIARLAKHEGRSFTNMVDFLLQLGTHAREFNPELSPDAYADDDEK